MPTLIQFAYEGGKNYRFGHNSIPKIQVTGAPSDADFSRWGMCHDGSAYHFFCFRSNTRDTIYPFQFNGSSYAYRHNSVHGELKFVDMPADVDPSSFKCLHNGSKFSFYMKKLGSKDTLYQFRPVDNTNKLHWGGDNAIKELEISGFPADSDKNRWIMLHDGSAYRYYTMQLGSNDKLYQGAYNGRTYSYGHNSIPLLNLLDTPADSDLSSAGMLHDGSAYRFYFLQQE